MAAKVYRDIKELKPELQPLVAEFLKRAVTGGWHADLTETYRSQARQLELYKAGKTPAKVSTYHNWRLAFDIAMFKNGRKQVSWDFKLYEKVAPIAEKQGWTWGGRWKVKDGCHFQWEGALPGTKVTLCRMGTKIFDPEGEHLSPAELKKRFGTNYKVFQIPNVCKGIEDKLTLAKQELKVRITERDTERKAKESYATRLAQVEKDNIALNTKVTYYGGRIDDLLKKMGQDEKDTKRLMENSAKALVEKGKRIQELESLVNSLTADAELGAGVRTIYQATKNALERILGRIKHD